MSILHHPSEDVLLDHAAGRLGRGAALVVDTPLCACVSCRVETDQIGFHPWREMAEQDREGFAVALDRDGQDQPCGLLRRKP